MTDLLKEKQQGKIQCYSVTIIIIAAVLLWSAGLNWIAGTGGYLVFAQVLLSMLFLLLLVLAKHNEYIDMGAIAIVYSVGVLLLAAIANITSPDITLFIGMFALVATSGLLIEKKNQFYIFIISFYLGYCMLTVFQLTKLPVFVDIKLHFGFLALATIVAIHKRYIFSLISNYSKTYTRIKQEHDIALRDQAAPKDIGYQNMHDQLQQKIDELTEKVHDLEEQNSVMIDRELRMVELKKELQRLTLGKDTPYDGTITD